MIDFHKMVDIKETTVACIILKGVQIVFQIVITLTILNVEGKIYYIFNLFALAPQLLFLFNYVMVMRDHAKPFNKLMTVCLFSEVVISCMMILEIMFEWWDKAFDGTVASIICILLSSVFTVGWSILLYLIWTHLGYKDIVE